jgi:hypothetical protein
MMFKSVVREKRFDDVYRRVDARLLACRDPKSIINFCNIGNMPKYEMEFPSTHLMNRMKITMI